MKKRSFLGKFEDDIKHHVLEYFLLVTSALFFLVFLSIFRGQHSRQFVVSAIFILYYVTWAIIHHARDQSLHLKIVLEYIVIGALALFVFRTLLFS